MCDSLWLSCLGFPLSCPTQMLIILSHTVSREVLLAAGNKTQKTFPGRVRVKLALNEGHKKTTKKPRKTPQSDWIRTKPPQRPGLSGTPHNPRSPQRTPPGPGPFRPGRPPTRSTYGPGPLLSRCPPQGRHLHEKQTRGDVG